MKKLSFKELGLLLLPVTALGLIGLFLPGRVSEPVEQERITRVYNDGRQAIVEGQLNTPRELLLSINNGQPSWISSVSHKSGTFKAFIKPSKQIPLGKDSFGHGFIFITGAGQINVAIIKGGPVPYGKFVLRSNNTITQRQGVFTVADIKQENGTLLPVSVQLKAKP